VVALGVLILLPVFHPMRGTFGSYHPLPLVRPAFSLFSLSVFTKMTFGALCGFEFVAIFAGECRNPARTLARSVLFAAPIIAFLYVFSTSAILAFLPSGQVNLIGPVPQALKRWTQLVWSSKYSRSGYDPTPAGKHALHCQSHFQRKFSATDGRGLGQFATQMVHALHPKYKTPTNSILFIASVTLAASVVVLIGVNEEEAFSLIQIWVLHSTGSHTWSCSRYRW